MSDSKEPSCMDCGSTNYDADENERRYEYEVGGYVDVLWTYCKPCDCWTEHPSSPSRTTGGLNGR